MKMQYQKQKRALALLMSAALLLSAALSGCSAGDTSSQQDMPAAESNDSVPELGTDYVPSSMTEDKTETVYVKASPDGTPREITVETRLRNPGKGEEIQDFTRLSDIKNTEGDEEFARSADGSLVWENHGEDIHYKGVSSDMLPVTVQVSYYLDGEPIAPEALAGQSGRVRIRFDYENHTAETVTIEEYAPQEGDEEEDAPREKIQKEVQTPVPFGVFSALFLDADTFSNIEVTNGKAVDLDGENVVIGYAFPGLAESLKLADYEPTEELSIPDYVEVTADVTNFSLDFTATVVSSGLFSDIDLTDLDDADELVDDMKKLSDASQELVEGTEALYDGASEFSDYLSEYVKGVGMVDQGAAALTDGLKQLKDGKDTLEEGAAALTDALAEANSLLQEGLSALEEALQEDSSPDSELAQLVSAVKALVKDAQALASQLAGLRETLEQLDSFTENAEAYRAAVEKAVAAAQDILSSIDLDQLESDAAAQVRRQVEKAVAEALQDTDLTDEEKDAIREQISDSIDLSGVTDQVREQLETAQKRLSELPELEIPELSIDAGSINRLLDDMEVQLTVLSAYSAALAELFEDFTDLSAVLETLRAGSQELQAGSSQLSAGITAFSDGIDALYDGAGQLSSGTHELKTAGSALKEGFSALVDGTRELSEGFATFDEDGIQSLADLAGDDLRAIFTQLRALKAADAGYQNFAGLREGQTGSVKFIIETDEIAS